VLAQHQLMGEAKGWLTFDMVLLAEYRRSLWRAHKLTRRPIWKLLQRLTR